MRDYEEFSVIQYDDGTFKGALGKVGELKHALRLGKMNLHEFMRYQASMEKESFEVRKLKVTLELGE